MADDDTEQRQEHAWLEKWSFLLTLILVTVLFFFLLKPFFAAIFWACLIGLIFYPVYRRFLNLWGYRPNLAAIATLGVCLGIGIVPALFVLGSFFKEGAELYQRLQTGEFDLGERIEQIKTAFPAVQSLLERFNIDLTMIREQLSGAALTASQFVAQYAVQVGQNVVRFFVSLGLMLYVAFFLLRDGNKLVALLVRALPLGDRREQLLFSKFAEVARATIKGNLAVGVVQGSLGGIIFWILGIPGAFLWGVVMTVLSLIPVVGAGLIWMPVAIYLIAVGHWGKGLILIAFGVGVIGLVDNVLRPILVGRDTKLPDYIVLLSTLGGFALFGINGFVIGPLVAALFVAFWGIFIREFYTPQSLASTEEMSGEGAGSDEEV
ncbi:MAG: AI-2E family transporter [Syntrophotaleaceae bacterium]